MKAIRHLTRILPAIARKAPDLAVESDRALAVRGDAPHAHADAGSAILELSSNLQQDVEGERYMVGTCFAELMRADPIAATTLLLQSCNCPACTSSLQQTGGNRQLSVRAPRSRSQAATRCSPPWSMRSPRNAGPRRSRLRPSRHRPSRTPRSDLARLVRELHHGEAWKRLLARSASAPSAALARALLPALSTATLYAHHETWKRQRTPHAAPSPC